VLTGRGLCNGLTTRPEESYRLWGVIVCDQEPSKTRRPKPATGLWKYNHNGCRPGTQTNKLISVRGSVDRKDYVTEKFQWPMNRTRDLPVCSIVP
jgi:hypothetical protein